MGLHLPDLRLHEQTDEMEGIQKADRYEDEDIRKEFAFGQIHIRQHNERYEYFELGRIPYVLGLL